MSITSKNIFTWDSSKDRGPRGFPGAPGGITTPSANDILTALLTVDGAGSGLDADLLDGNHAAYFAPIASPTFTGNVGIGTAPDQPLTVLGCISQKGGSGGTARSYISHSSGSGSWSNIDTDNDFVIRNSAASVIITARNASGDIKFATGATDTQKAIITNAGLFGIGLTPSESMYVDSVGSMRINNGGGLYLKNGYSAVIKNPNNNTRDIGFYQDSDALKYFFKGSGQMYIDGGLHIGGTSEAGDNNLWVDGNVQEPSFNAGWQGTNWQINAAGDAEFGNVRIRGGLQVYELIVNQLHYQNGGLVIGAGAGKVKSVYSATVGSEQLYFETPEGTAMSPFSVGAIVMVQRVDINRSTVVKKYVRQVSAIQADQRVDLITTTGWLTTSDVGIFEAGDEVVTIGHVSDTALDSSIYMSATDADNPFMRIYDGVNTYGKFSLSDKTTIKLQLGNLASLASYDILPASPGYGLYCNNVYLTGKMVLPTAGMTDEGALSSSIRIYAGDIYENRAMAPFRVTQNGSLTATGVAEIGTAPNSSGYGVAIKGGDIWENLKNASSILGINYHGYSDGTTQYRTTTIYDGKENTLLSCQGSATPTVNIGYVGSSLVCTVFGKLQATGNLEIDQNSQLDGTLLVSGAATFNSTLRIPDLASAPSPAVRGMIYVSSASGRFWGYNGTGWVLLDYNG